MNSLAIGSWQPGIGDPSLIGWFTVCSYYLTATLCLLRMVIERQRKGEGTFWGIICFGMILLGVTKQFNLLGALTEMGRMMALSGSWIEQRKVVQTWAMVVVIGVIVLTAITINTLFARVVTRNVLTICGFAYLVALVILRGISLHQFGAALSYEIWGIRINWLAELSGVYLVCLSSFWNMTRRA